MFPVTSDALNSYASRMSGTASLSKKKEQDIWSDNINYVEMDETWFDSIDTDMGEAWHDAEAHEGACGCGNVPRKSAGKIADAQVPITEDLRRSAKQLIRTLGGCGEGKVFSHCLSQILPGASGNLVAMAHSVYNAVTTGQNYETVAMHAIGMASQCLPPDKNIISMTAAYIRDTVSDWVDDTFLEHFLGDKENHTATNVFTALAITAMVAQWGMKSEAAPQRLILKVPDFAANLFLRVKHYWSALGSMVQPALPSGEESVAAQSWSPDPQPSSPAAARSNGDALLPLVGVSVAVPVATTFMQALKSKAPVAAGVTAGLTVATAAGMAGKWMWDKVSSEVNQATGAWNATDTSRGVYTGNNSPAIIGGNESAVNVIYNSVSKAAPESANQIKESGGTWEKAFGNYSLPHHDDKGNTTGHMLRHLDKAGPAGLSDAANNEAIACAPVKKSYGKPKSFKRLVRMLQKASFLDTSRRPQSFTRVEVAAAVGHILYSPDPRIRSNVAQHDQRLLMAARYILEAEQFYGGKSGEDLTAEQADSVIRNWLFDSVLGMSAERYIAGKVAGYVYPEQITANMPNSMLNSAVQEDGRLASLSSAQKIFFQKLWNDALDKTLPFRNWSNTDPVQLLSITDDAFVWMHTGALWLADTGIDLRNTTHEECRVTGKALWEMAVSGNITTNHLKYFELPAVLFQPEKCLNNTTPTDTLNAIIKYIQHRREVTNIYEDFSTKVKNLINETAAWRSRGNITEGYVSQCPKDVLTNIAYPELFEQRAHPTKQQILDHGLFKVKQKYLNGATQKGCPDVDVTDEFRLKTERIADAFMPVDEYYLAMAMGNAPKNELDFINSPNSIIRQISSTLTTYIGRGVNYVDKKIELQNTDLYSVTVGKEERIYSFIPQNNQGYKFERIDKNKGKYLQYNLFGIKNSRSTVLDKEDSIKIGSSVTGNWHKYRQSFSVSKPPVTGNDTAAVNFLQYVKKKHRQEFYDQMYSGGYDPSIGEQTWNFVKHFIPFYDCATEKFPENLGSCLLDALMLIPLAGQSAALLSKFSQGLARGVRVGMAAKGISATKAIITGVAKEISLPTLGQITSLSKNAIGVIDPGFDLIRGVSKVSYKGVAKLANWIRAGKNADNIRILEEILKKIPAQNDLKAAQKMSPSEYKMANFPNLEMKLPVTNVGKKNGHKVYVIADPETGEKFGKKYFINKKGELKTHIRNKNNKKPFIMTDPCTGRRIKRSLDDVCVPSKFPPATTPNDNRVYQIPNIDTEGQSFETVRLSSLKTHNPVRHEIIEKMFANSVTVSNHAVRRLSEMSNKRLIQFVEDAYRLVISEESAAVLRNNIIEGNEALKIMNRDIDSRVVIGINSGEEVDTLGIYLKNQGFVIIYERLFKQSPPVILETILHETSHATETGDYIYMDKNIPHASKQIKKHPHIGETNEQVSDFYNHLNHNIKEKGFYMEVNPQMEFIRKDLSEDEMSNFIGSYVHAEDSKIPSDIENGLINSADFVSQMTVFLSGVPNKHMQKKLKIKLDSISELMAHPDRSRDFILNDNRGVVIG